jgi:hypothetical protein
MEGFAGQLGACAAEMGPHYDSINEAVIQPVKNAAGGNGAVATCRFAP